MGKRASKQVAGEKTRSGIDFKDWRPLLFQRCSDYLVALLNIKIGIFPTALTTGDWKNLYMARELILSS